MEKLKILYIITASDTGGAQKYISDLAKNLDFNRFAPIIRYGGRDLRWLSNRISPLTLFHNELLAIIELIQLLRSERPNIVHLNSSKAGVLGSVASFLYNLSNRFTGSSVHRLKTVFTAHGWVFNPANHYPPYIRWCYVQLHKLAAMFQDIIICVSEYDRRLALQFHIAPIDKLITIHNGIDLARISFLKKEAARKEIANRLPGNYFYPFWIGSVGRLAKEKNYQTLIDAATQVPEALFFIIGNGPEKSNLESQIKECNLEDRFFIAPPTGDDAKLLKAFDVFTLPSIKEGLPYALLEAMAAGLPCVVTDAGGMGEVVRDGDDGICVPRQDARALAAGITKALRMKPANRTQRLQSFSLERMVAQTASCYVAVTT